MSQPDKQKDGAKVKDYLQAKGYKKADLDKQKWTKAEDIISSVVKLHGRTWEEYKASGLG